MRLPVAQKLGVPILIGAVTLAAQPAWADPPPAASVDVAQSTSSETDGVFRYLGGKPWGTYINQLRHADVAFVTSHTPLSGDGWLTGFSYSERGGYVGYLIISAIAGAAAQDTANRQQRTVTYNVPRDREGRLGFGLDVLSGSTSEGLEASSLRIDLNWLLSTNALSVDDELPVTTSIGFMLAYYSYHTHREAGPGHSEGINMHNSLGYGISVVGAYPITRWGQLDMRFFGNFEGWGVSEASVGGTANLGNRFFVSGAATWIAWDLGAELRLGVRL